MNSEAPVVTQKFPNVWKSDSIRREILQNMEVSDLLNLSLCSKRTFKTISPICAQLDPELEIHFKFDETRMVTFSHGLDVQTPRSRVSWQNSEEEEDSFLKTWISSQSKIEHILQFFDSAEIAAKLDLDIDPESAERMLAWAKQREHCLSRLSYSGSNDEMALKFLKTFPNCFRLSLAAKLSQDFRVEFPIESPYLFVYNAHWVTMENIWNFKGEGFVIYDTNLQNEDLNLFLKAWKSGSRNVQQNMHLVMTFEDMNIPTIVLDIPHVARQNRRSDQQEYTIYKVFNDDNTTVATIGYDETTPRKLVIRFEDNDN
ncbi:hypothetical protein B9Z55_025358 [Caenorhabditis nigoni]|uniref:F-box domain-containing protein n=1 Tax=Caenorhabditis nigoni TaxID=1611254 RepID=A0A2G5SYH6_9PELO|nr:hypothetical protein B9Z55_025358 [Caenorhabditis nigoni]